MSILRKPYEISVWDDVWSTTDSKFVEQRLGIIGSSEMESQSRAIEPELTRNVNGTKKFSFKLYKRYKDNITGETVENPFYGWLANERKVKLNYDGTWYDFVIKNISEPSSNYLYTYQLEDANVQELSKNGFNFIFDAELQNNLGTSEELAAKLLEGTDWDVGNCDVPVQTIDEALVYLRVVKEGGITATQITDQPENNQGNGIDDNTTVNIRQGEILLAAYSSCTGRPHRFQFFWVAGMVNNDGKIAEDVLTTDDNRIINNKDCQYYIDYPYPKNFTIIEGTNFVLPADFNTTSVIENLYTDSGVTLSSKFRGKRYGFTQKTEFIPVLNKYVNIYKKGNEEYYGYEFTEYKSPLLIQNIITGSQFKSSSGWTGTYVLNEPYTDKEDIEKIKKSQKAEVNAIQARIDGAFITSTEDLKNGSFASQDYTPFMKFTIPSPKDDEEQLLEYGNYAIINSGPYDNRKNIGNMQVGDEYILTYSGINEVGSNLDNLNFLLGEYIYSSDLGGYCINTEEIEFTSSRDLVNNTVIFRVTKSEYSEESFKKNSKVRLCITGMPGTYYLSNIQLYKIVYDENREIIKPDENLDYTTAAKGVVNTSYYYFTKDKIKDITSADQLVPNEITKELSYSTYIPVYNSYAQKVRTVSAKESNYFNILQSIAETFEQWLEINVGHNQDGAINSKSISFRNYIGNDNYVGFKYGVNLKDIKRTYESKQLATKLIVKQNNNEFAPNGFCTIARANSNPLGENYLYDFQYFFKGMLDPEAYLEDVYVVDGAIGKDINEDHEEWNSKGYLPRIKALNVEIQNNNELFVQISQDLTQALAELEVASAGLAAATEGIEESEEELRFLTKMNSSDLSWYINSLKEEEQKVFMERTDIKNIIQKILTYQTEKKQYNNTVTRLTEIYSKLLERYNNLKENIQNKTDYKEEINKCFFEKYARFIQEGTWINEDYVDDEKYYADALSVLYNSCYPKVAYDVNVIEISKLPGYENYLYQLGDQTFIEDKEFFGDDFRVSVVVTETTDNLDDPSKNKIKIQNFKNQFQDLFQKITATVQQTQYNTGAYEKAVALAEASQSRKQQFVTDALDSMSARLSIAGQQSVSIGNDGITVTDVDSPSDQIRMVGGAILLSKQDDNGEQKWTTGLTSDGMSANLITAGVINAGQVAIMNAREPIFRWDSYGISAFDATWANDNNVEVISGVNHDKFVRFDKHGIYGINGGANGLNWHPSGQNGLKEISEKATFALTWDGLKVTGNNATTWIGKHDYQIGTDNEGKPKFASRMIRVVDNNENETFSVDDRGNVSIRGNFTIGGIDSSSGSSEDMTFVEYVKKQVDEKASLYYLNTDPAEYEDNSETGKKAWGADQIGSMWRCTAKITSNKSTKDSTQVTRNINSEWIWQELPQIGYGWHEMEIPNNIFDAYDGKNTIHVKKPNSYKERDLWIVDQTYTSSEKTYTVGTLMVATKNSSGEWKAEEWEEKIKYTDDTVANSKMNPIVDTNNFSWKFDQDDGMYMYTGSKKTDNEVFKIYKDDETGIYQLWMKGNGEFEGQIKALKGTIAGFEIGKTGDNISYISSDEKESYNDEADGIYLGPDGIGLGEGFYLDKAGAGKMGGWYIGKMSFCARDNDINMCGINFGKNLVGESLVPEYNKKDTPISFFSGWYNKDDFTDYRFKILYDGSLYATNAKISGDLDIINGTVSGILTIKDEKNSTECSFNSNGYFVEAPGFKIKKEGFNSVVGKKEIKSFVQLTSGRLGDLFVDTDQITSTPQIYLTSEGIRMFETVYNNTNHRNCVSWSNNDGNLICRLRCGTPKDGTSGTAINLEGVTYSNSSLDFVAFGMSMREMYEKVKELESLLGQVDITLKFASSDVLQWNEVSGASYYSLCTDSTTIGNLITKQNVFTYDLYNNYCPPQNLDLYVEAYKDSSSLKPIATSSKKNYDNTFKLNQDGDTVSWKQYKGAKYTIKYDTKTLITNSTNNSFDISDYENTMGNGQHTITASMVYNGATYNSQNSLVVTIQGFSIEIIGNTIYWDKYSDDVQEYEIYIDNTYTTFVGGANLSYELDLGPGGYYIQVAPSINGYPEIYSEPIYYISTAEFEVSLTNKTISWDPPNDASYYKLKINGSIQSTQYSGNTINLAQIGVEGNNTFTLCVYNNNNTKIAESESFTCDLGYIQKIDMPWDLQAGFIGEASNYNGSYFKLFFKSGTSYIDSTTFDGSLSTPEFFMLLHSANPSSKSKIIYQIRCYDNSENIVAQTDEITISLRGKWSAVTPSYDGYGTKISISLAGTYKREVYGYVYENNSYDTGIQATDYHVSGTNLYFKTIKYYEDFMFKQNDNAYVIVVYRKTDGSLYSIQFCTNYITIEELIQ